MNKLKTLTTKISVYREKDNPVFGETVTNIILDDEAGGPFFILQQICDDIVPGEVRLDLEELKIICKIADGMIKSYPTKE